MFSLVGSALSSCGGQLTPHVSPGSTFKKVEVGPGEEPVSWPPPEHGTQDAGFSRFMPVGGRAALLPRPEGCDRGEEVCLQEERGAHGSCFLTVSSS